MSNNIHFYFDFTSPYGYLASERIETIAQRMGKQITWHPVLLGAVFKITGQAPLTEAPMKGDYAIRDFSRSAREHGVAYEHPSNFPVAAVAPCRAALWLRDNTDSTLQAKTADFIHAMFRGFFVQGQDITDKAVVGKIADSLGIDSQAMLEAIATQEVKDALRAEVEKSIEAGVFGSPMMIVNDEPFWGHDRLEQMERWVSQGGW